MKKKLFLASLAAIGIFAMSACSKSQSLDDDLVSMKGGSITIGDYYNEIKSSQSSTLQSMVIYKVFDNAYGDKITDKTLNAKYKEIAGNYDDFDSTLKQYGYTEKTYKAYIRQQLAYEKGMKENVKLTDDDLKAAWESYHPEVSAQIISVADEDTANKLKKEIDAGGDFTELAKKNSTDESKDDGGKVKFDSSSTTYPAELLTAAFALKDGEVSDVVSSTNSSTYTTTFYIVKMTKNVDKGTDMKKYEKEVKEAATNAQIADSAFVNKIVAKELKAANVKIKDDTFSDLLAGYLTDSSDSSAKESSTKESSTADSTAESTASSTAASSTAESTSSSK